MAGADGVVFDDVVSRRSVHSMKCPVCDAKVPESATFCQQCGAKLPQFGGAGRLPSERPNGRGARRIAIASTDSTSRVTTARPSSRRRGTIVDTPEETLWEGSYSPKAMLGTAVVLCGVATIVLLVVALALCHRSNVRTLLLALIVVVWALAAVSAWPRGGWVSRTS